MAHYTKQYKIDARSGLVLEGGGMRGVFTTGVLDNLMDRGIHFPYAIGVSAGACNGLSYASWQRGRAKYSNIDMLDRYHYIGLKYLLTKRNIMDFDLLFDEFPNRIIPYDYAAYAASNIRFEMVATDIATGRAAYLTEGHDPERLLAIVKASSSLPYVCPIAEVDGRRMLDGGIADSIPVARARAVGFDNLLVVLTRNKGYRKPEGRSFVPPFAYGRYPALRRALAERNALYNEQIADVEAREARGEVVVIRPKRPIEVGRMERDTRKLLDLYNEGYNAAQEVEFHLP